eukprot:m51a1_g11820 putative 3-phosphoglycerate dehydrogenase (314) ;mRNA; r:409485-410535
MSSHKTVLVAQKPFAKDATEKIMAVAKEAGYNLVPFQSYKTTAELYEAVADAEALIVRSDAVDEKVLEAAKNLKLVVRAGAGYDTIDLAACTKRGVVVMNTPGQNSNAVGELAIGYLITMARCGFNGKMGTELRGKRLGLHGYGNTAKWAATIAKGGFGMEVVAYDPFVTPEQFAAAGVQHAATFQELYATCDMVSIHTPLNKDTRGCVNLAVLQSMKKGGMVVNTARAEVVDEAALKEMLQKRPDFKYATDVIAAPVGAEIKAAYPDRFFYSAVKSGAQTEEANTNCGIAAMKQTVEFFEKGETRFQVNKAK